MRQIIVFILMAALPHFCIPLNADDSKSTKANEAQVAALRAADDARLAAMKSPDKNKLGAILSDDLHYSHSTGLVDTKSSLTDLLTSGKSKYVEFDYEKREFTFPAPGIAIMTGRVRIRVSNQEGTTDNPLCFLAVWRNENGQWRFLAWQSCKLPPKTS